MIFFVVVFAAEFNLINFIEKCNDYDKSNLEHFDENRSEDTQYLDPNQILDQFLSSKSEVYPDVDVDLTVFDSLQSINQSENLESEISPGVASIIKKNENIDHSTKENNSENITIFTLPKNMCSKANDVNCEITFNNKKIEMSIEETVINPHLLDLLNQYEQDLINNDVNFTINTDSIISSNEKLVQEHPELKINPHNLPSISSELNPKNKNDIASNSIVTPDNILNDQTKYISNEITQCHYITNNRNHALISVLTLDDAQLKIIPNLILYKECLESLSMKHNAISFIPERMRKLNSLRKLDLSYNNIKKIHYRIKNLNLEWLDLSYNSLTYSSCKPIFAMTTLKYLNLQNNNIKLIERFKSEGLMNLSISNNPIVKIHNYFYELPNIVQLFMSNLKVTKSIYFHKILSKLKILDLSCNKVNQRICNIEILTALEEVNLSNCGINHFPIYLKLFNLKKLILSKNKIRFFSINFKELRNSIKILDLRENPLKTFSTKHYLGALDIVACYSGKVLLDEYILQSIQKLSFDQIYSQKYEKERIYFKKVRNNKITNDLNINIMNEILEINDKKVRKNGEKLIALVGEMRDSGFIGFQKTMKEAMKIIKRNICKHIRIKKILTYLNTKFSSKFYRFLEGILFNYKLESLKSALIYIYNSDEHLNYWMYHLRDSLSFTDAEPIQENPEIHKDKNIILWSFINIINSNELINIIKLQLEKDREMVEILYSLLCNMDDQFKISLRDGIVKEIETLQDDHIKYILKRYQIIDQSQ